MKRRVRPGFFFACGTGALVYLFAFVLGARGDERPSMHCEIEASAYDGVRCTGFNIGDLVPEWDAYVSPVRKGASASFHSQGHSIVIPVGTKWTLIVMSVSDTQRTVRTRAWARKPNPSAAPHFRPWRAGEESPD